MGNATVTRSDVMVALSRATDLATGQPIGFAMTSCLLADRLARLAGFDEPARLSVLQQGLLRYIGCNSETHAMAALLGDEIAFRKDFSRIDAANAGQVMGLVFKHLRRTNAGLPLFSAITKISRTFIASRSESTRILESHCEVAQRLGQRLGLTQETSQGLGQLYARWDGKGIPAGLKGNGIAPAVRVVGLAQDALILREAFGEAEALAQLKARAGHAHEPKLMAVLLENASGLFDGIDDPTSAEIKKLLAQDDDALDEAGLDEACLALADFIDLKTPFTIGHSRALAELASGAGKARGLPASSIVQLRLAALVHDLGQAGVPARMLMKAGAYGTAEWEQVRLHSYYSERVLAAAPGLAKLAELAGLHHERLDGSGYHHAARGAALSVEARILTAAEAFQNKIEARPHRAAHSPQAAAELLQKEVRQGGLDAEAVLAVIKAAGVKTNRPLGDAGELTPRENEILRALAQGLSMKEVGRALGISPKTVDNHIQSIYPKIGVRTRGGAVLYAVEHGLTGA